MLLDYLNVLFVDTKRHLSTVFVFTNLGYEVCLRLNS